MGLCGFEPQTSRLSGGRSNQLSYRPVSLDRWTGSEERERGWPLTTARAPIDQHSPDLERSGKHCLFILRKEVIQPQVPLRLPCYDLVPITELTFGAVLPRVRLATTGAPSFRGLTGGVYKAQEHIHRSIADLRLLAIPASCRRVAACNPN